jgi:hypothetical protein
VHCASESPCEPRDSHLAPCSDGCDDVPGGIVPVEGVLGDRMLSEVRAQWNAWHDGLSDAEIAALRPRRRLPREDGEIVIDQRNGIHVRPVNGRYLGTLPRRTPGATLPYEPLIDRGPNHPPWQTQEMPAYGQVPVARVLEAERRAYLNGWQ